MAIFSSMRMRIGNSLLSKKTLLYDFHVSQGAKIVDFGGWAMPVQYPDLDIKSSSVHTRKGCSIFDVSHMGQLQIRGKDRARFVESMTTLSLSGKAPGSSTLTVMTNGDGGIIDDTIVTVFDDHVQMVLNAGCVEKDMKHIEGVVKSELGKGISLNFLDGQGLLAFQGPTAERLLTGLIPELASVFRDLQFMTSKAAVMSKLYGELGIARCGYTGEDGFEISIKGRGAAEALIGAALNAGGKMAGLGARDILRIEAGLCLYGHEIDEKTSPVEAGLAWLIAKDRRNLSHGASGVRFPGYEKIMAQLTPAGAPARKLSGLVLQSQPGSNAAMPVPRQGCVLRDPSDPTKEVGVVTSGTLSPTLNKVVAIAFLEAHLIKAAPGSASGRSVLVDVRGKMYPAEAVKLPFVPHNYKR